jgi:hypothetical protein
MVNGGLISGTARMEKANGLGGSLVAPEFLDLCQRQAVDILLGKVLDPDLLRLCLGGFELRLRIRLGRWAVLSLYRRPAR